ncbi:GntR family phosphonate transport system transcriptional regulator [Chitinivorax tropicus]|uniref:GntR family phosphonate transport system transcriptional regulator n=1 Tax=Chitinivorax tropicus TaxID=714531 RepID=A0A840MPC0_9PROT|nr:phosphonate metabolism transcriptional regulator PhnF [Chitinivorax tropicus]MBB5018592.1 GntR family phosphonate transport system transcriptional regulator [Chitinivorax tropicus]
MSEIRASRPAGTPLWISIEAALNDDILQGRLQGRLPNEQQLADRFHVNRHTVRQAVQSLQAKGLVRVEHGRGTFVQEDMIDYRLGRSSRFSHSLARQHMLGDVAIQSCATELASADVAHLLDLPVASPVLRVESLDLADDKVVSVCTQYFPLPRFEGFADNYRTHTSTAAAFAAIGIDRFSRVLSRISARLPSSRVAKALQQPKTQPVLYVESVYADADGVRIEYGITRFNGHAVQVVIEPD